VIFFNLFLFFIHGVLSESLGTLDPYEAKVLRDYRTGASIEFVAEVAPGVIPIAAAGVVKSVSNTAAKLKIQAAKRAMGRGGVARFRAELTFQGGRSIPGTAHASGQLVNPETLLRGTHGNAGNVPADIAAALKGKTFTSFDQFRGEFWKTMAGSKYSKEFGKSNLERMLKGNAPVALREQSIGSRITYELHHKTPIKSGGATYDLSNIVITTPRYHAEILEKGFHYGVK
jgi:hypothetical protein